jgi:two-component system cell cycle response regulator DivK
MVGVRMTKKVLIVEDNELNMKLFHDLLEAQGYETLQTREGLRRCRSPVSTSPT